MKHVRYSHLAALLSASCTHDIARVDYAWTDQKCVVSTDEASSSPSQDAISKLLASGRWDLSDPTARGMAARECCVAVDARFIGWQHVSDATGPVAPLCIFGAGRGRLPYQRERDSVLREELRRIGDSGGMGTFINE